MTVILNKSAPNAIENAVQMSVPQSEKTALREMAREQPLPDYVKLCKQLEDDIINADYEVLDIVDSNTANAEWNDIGYDLPPIANNTKAFKVKAGNYEYARVFKEGVNTPVSRFILRYGDIKTFTAKEIADKYALPQIPDKIVHIKLPPEIPLEISIVGQQKEWGTVGGSVQYAIKYSRIKDSWFYKIEKLK